MYFVRILAVRTFYFKSISFTSVKLTFDLCEHLFLDKKIAII